jgi:hypothetical protein
MVFYHDAHAGTSARAQLNSLSPVMPGDGTAMAEIRAGSIWLQEFWHSCVCTMADGKSDLSEYLRNALI